jgi:hypothetical protein
VQAPSVVLVDEPRGTRWRGHGVDVADVGRGLGGIRESSLVCVGVAPAQSGSSPCVCGGSIIATSDVGALSASDATIENGKGAGRAKGGRRLAGRIRTTLLVGLILALLPSPAFAHTIGGSGGAEIEILILGIATTVFGLSLRSSEMARAWVPWAVLGLGIALVAASFVVPRITRNAGRSFARLAIAEPADGAEVPAKKRVPVKVEVDNAPVAATPTSTSGGHLHLYVDGKLEQMPYGTKAEVRLSPGTHKLTVEYVSVDHLSFSPRVTKSVTVTAVPGLVRAG